MSDHLPVSSQRVGYRYRVYPSADQRLEFERVFECVRLVFNDHLFANGFGVFGPRLPYRKGRKMQSVLVTKAKKSADRKRLTEVPDTALRQSVADAHDACQRFLNSASTAGRHPIVEEPKYKDPNDARQTFRLGNQDISLHRVSARMALLRLPKTLGSLHLIMSRNLPSGPTSVTITKEADGRYYASFVVVRETDSPPRLVRWAGVDLGLTSLASIVYSDGTREKIPALGHFRREEQRIKAAQRKMWRAQDDSKNREKARLELAGLHRVVRDRRRDALHKLAFRLVSENQSIAFETLGITDLTSGRLSKKIYDAGWGILVKLVCHKAERYGRAVVQIDRYEPTSQTCAPCGAKDGPKELSIREWQCPRCGALLDRDYNAAVNVLVAAGCAETLNAGGRALRILLSRVASEAGTAGKATDRLVT